MKPHIAFAFLFAVSAVIADEIVFEKRTNGHEFHITMSEKDELLYISPNVVVNGTYQTFKLYSDGENIWKSITPKSIFDSIKFLDVIKDKNNGIVLYNDPPFIEASWFNSQTNDSNLLDSVMIYREMEALGNVVKAGEFVSFSTNNTADVELWITPDIKETWRVSEKEAVFVKRTNVSKEEMRLKHEETIVKQKETIVHDLGALYHAVEFYDKSGKLSAFELPHTPIKKKLSYKDITIGAEQGDEIWEVVFSKALPGEKRERSRIVHVNAMTGQSAFFTGVYKENEMPPLANLSQTLKGNLLKRQCEELTANFIKSKSTGGRKKINQALILMREYQGLPRNDLAFSAFYSLMESMGRIDERTEIPQSDLEAYYELLEYTNDAYPSDNLRKNHWAYPYIESETLRLSGGTELVYAKLRLDMLTDLQNSMERDENEGEDMSEIRKFIKKEARAILSDFPESEMIERLNDLAEGRESRPCFVCCLRQLFFPNRKRYSRLN